MRGTAGMRLVARRVAATNRGSFCFPRTVTLPSVFRLSSRGMRLSARHQAVRRPTALSYRPDREVVENQRRPIVVHTAKEPARLEQRGDTRHLAVRVNLERRERTVPTREGPQRAQKLPRETIAAVEHLHPMPAG
jgi:hypothetical protein